LKNGMRPSNRNIGTRYPHNTVRLRPPQARRSCKRLDIAVRTCRWAPLLSTPAAGLTHDLAGSTARSSSALDHERKCPGGLPLGMESSSTRKPRSGCCLLSGRSLVVVGQRRHTVVG
jgi:hypothetical protein